MKFFLSLPSVSLSYYVHSLLSMMTPDHPTDSQFLIKYTMKIARYNVLPHTILVGKTTHQLSVVIVTINLSISYSYKNIELDLPCYSYKDIMYQ